MRCLFVAAVLLLLSGCYEQATVTASANLVCYYNDKPVANLELEIVGSSLQYGDVSVLEGSWALCNWEKDIYCVYENKTNMQQLRQQKGLRGRDLPGEGREVLDASTDEVEALP